MAKLLGKCILVSKVEEEAKEGFQTIQVQDSFVYKGKVEDVTLQATEAGIKVGDIVIFKKYSPDTDDVELEGKKYKVVDVNDVRIIL